MTKLTRRERVHRCYFGEELDRPGVYSPALFPQGDDSYDELKAYLDEHTELRPGLSSPRYETRYPTTVRTEPTPEGGERRFVTLHTPAGDLERVEIVNLPGEPAMHESHYLKTPGDAEIYLSLPLPEPIGEPAADHREKDEAVGRRGIVEVRLGSNAGGAVVQLFGSELFAILSVTDRDVLHALCERQKKILMNRVKRLIEQGVGPYWSMAGQEYLVPPLHGAKDFYDFNVKYDKPVIDLIHEAGGRIHIHCHGSVKTVFQGFLDMGADVLHPFEAPPMGDITAREAKELARGRMCLEGNIQIADFYEQTPDRIRRQTEALIADCFDDRRQLIVCSSASPYIWGRGAECFERYKAVIDTVISRTA